MLLAALLVFGGLYVLADSSLRPRSWPGWLVLLNLFAIVDIEGLVIVWALLRGAYWISYGALVPEAWAFIRVGLWATRAARRGSHEARRAWALYAANALVWAAVLFVAYATWTRAA